MKVSYLCGLDRIVWWINKALIWIVQSTDFIKIRGMKWKMNSVSQSARLKEISTFSFVRSIFSIWLLGLCVYVCVLDFLLSCVKRFTSFSVQSLKTGFHLLVYSISTERGSSLDARKCIEIFVRERLTWYGPKCDYRINSSMWKRHNWIFIRPF